MRSYNAKTDLSAKLGYAVYVTTDTKVNNLPVAAICTSNLRAKGIIVDPPKGAAYSMAIAVDGEFTRAMAGDTITAGSPLKTDTNGALVVADTDKDHVVALAEEAASAGELFDVQVKIYDLAV